ncbi:MULTISPECIES: GNAT family N-acetyltransferase [unclassified Clostridium]|uniref:GNAT family N-acetyltransferase n=1 Tax=unclassified Clostridium TaxID=2614128 RepID=UPI001D4E1091|nr:GNAT family N-acetyltransferase [Clostridium botulinum]
MKTLIFNGSPRKDGDTVSLINELVKQLNGEYRIVNTYNCKINPCIDCRFCWKNEGCCVNDEMQEIYKYIQECDNILIASPIYFSELTGALLSVGSRLQTYFCGKFFRKEIPIKKPKKGAVIVVGGGDGSINKPYETACTLLHHMNSHDIFPLVYSHNTNSNSAITDINAIKGINGITKFFNERLYFNGGNKMIIQTERLEIIPLNTDQLKLWVEDIPALEKELNCSYKAESMEGFFLEIVKGQYEITRKDPNNYLWHSFFLLIRKDDRVVIGSADFKDIPNENGEVEIGYGIGKEFEHNGYMTEAAKAMCEWALKQNGVTSVIAETESDSFASQRILKCCGFEKYKEEETIWWKL